MNSIEFLPKSTLKLLSVSMWFILPHKNIKILDNDKSQ